MPSSCPATADGEMSHQGCFHRCNSCDYKTDKLSSLKVHTRVHAGKRSVECHFCHRSFPYRSDLKRHLRTHTGERPFQCPLCPQSFSQKHQGIPMIQQLPRVRIHSRDAHTDVTSVTIRLINSLILKYKSGSYRSATISLPHMSLELLSNAHPFATPAHSLCIGAFEPSSSY
ncbi:uncharacterized protein LOC142579558 isoform X2 [Dermacentor variabilis]